MLIKRAKNTLAFLRQAEGSNNYSILIEKKEKKKKTLQVFKIAKFEFKDKVHFSLWVKYIQLWPIKSFGFSFIVKYCIILGYLVRHDIKPKLNVDKEWNRNETEGGGKVISLPIYWLELSWLFLPLLMQIGCFYINDYYIFSRLRVVGEFQVRWD